MENKYIQAGRLREYITFYRQIIDNTTFDKKISYERSFSTKAECSYNTGGRVVVNDEIIYDKSRKFIVRYYCKVDDTMRIFYNNDYYQINQIADDKLNGLKTIYAEKIQL